MSNDRIAKISYLIPGVTVEKGSGSSAGSFSFNKKGTQYFASLELLMSFYKSLNEYGQKKFISHLNGKRYIFIYLHMIALQEYENDDYIVSKGEIISTIHAYSYCISSRKWNYDPGYIQPFPSPMEGKTVKPWQILEVDCPLKDKSVSKEIKALDGTLLKPHEYTADLTSEFNLGESFSFITGRSPFFPTEKMLLDYYDSLSNKDKLKHINLLGNNNYYLFIYQHSISLIKELLTNGETSKIGEIRFTTLISMYDFTNKKWENEEGFVKPTQRIFRGM